MGEKGSKKVMGRENVSKGRRAEKMRSDLNLNNPVYVHSSYLELKLASARVETLETNRTINRDLDLPRRSLDLANMLNHRDSIQILIQMAEAA